MYKNVSHRYERKFFISDLDKYKVELIVKLIPSKFSEIYHQRTVNNIYLDSYNLNNFMDNIDGNVQRVKARIRWYGELFGPIEKPVLELKMKNGLLGKKDIFKLNKFKLDRNYSSEIFLNTIKKSNIPEYIYDKINSFNPTLLNNYRRKYFQSADGNYRITIDSDLSFYNISRKNWSFLNKVSDKESVILELKYDQKYDDAAHHITNHFPFRITKSSKYVTGIENIY